jgi:hypothetical protein
MLRTVLVGNFICVQLLNLSSSLVVIKIVQMQNSTITKICSRFYNIVLSDIDLNI